MAYATTEDIQARMTRTLTDSELAVCASLLDDAGVLIDSYNAEASDEVKKVVSCRIIIRALGSENDIPIGATQGSMSGLSYSQSWTIGNGGSVGEIYIGKAEKKLLGVGNNIISHSPLEDFGGEE